MRVIYKFGFALILVAALFVAFLFFYAPEHWMRRVSNFGTATIDGRRVPAAMYLGNPTTNEAEAFLLVRIPGEGSYLFNFLDEDFRQVSTHELVPLYFGCVIFRSMTKGHWLQGLAPLKVDEFRILTPTGHSLTVELGSD
jgi:hypothetical protein